MVVTKAVRKSVEAKVKLVLRRYQGKYIPIAGLLHELGGDSVYITRETARKWLVRLGCEAKGSGLFYVPLPGAATSQRAATSGPTIERETT
jgi:hypothetical protein